jgi:hypothetical protein
MYKVYALTNNKSISFGITFYKNFYDMLSDINIRYIHTFIFDFDYYEKNKLTKWDNNYYMHFDKFDIFEFEFEDNDELSFSYDCGTELIPMTANIFLSETSKRINATIENLFTHSKNQKEFNNTVINIFSGKTQKYDTFNVSNFIFLYNIKFEEIKK